ncbi:MAG TPA: threonine ammonia-lyase [Myxococcota bacterium]|nr:threonine ammonia-lyase [Myxococcota bacterium]
MLDRPEPAEHLPLPVTFDDIEDARRLIRPWVYESPCAFSQSLSNLTRTRCYLKLENLQMTGSYKERGALNRLARLTPEEARRGVIAFSAGNHAQGVAYHAQRLGIDATIVMPLYTPLVKVTSTRRYGAHVILFGESAAEARAESFRIAAAEGRTYIHPFDDPWVVAGQGTVGLELLEQNPYLDAVVVPVGGGGLIAGLALAMKETNPRIKIYGVESEAMASMRASLKAGQLVEVPSRRTLAEGIAVSRVGDIPFQLCQRYVDDVITVDDEEIASAVLTLLEVEKTVVEGSGAAALAAVVNGHLPVAGKKVALVLTGGNIDVTMLARIIERGLVKDGRMVRLAARVVDAPGALAKLTARIAELGGNILQINHERAFARGPLGVSLVEVTLEARGHEHIKEIVTGLESVGINTTLE